MNMMVLQKAIACVLFLQSGLKDVQSKENKGQASSGNFLIHEEYYMNISYFGEISVSSNVPVTIQRYCDDAMQLHMYNEAKVLVTSDCADIYSTDTTFVPQVTWGANSIEVSIQDAPANNMTYLQPSSYFANWTYDSNFCRTFPEIIVPEFPTSGAVSLKSAFPFSVITLLQRIMMTNGRETTNNVARNFQSSTACNVNVEVLLDGCSHAMNVTAPTVRVINATLENLQQQKNSQDNCISEYQGEIMFTGEPVLQGTQSLNVPQMECNKPFYERPLSNAPSAINDAKGDSL